MKTIIYLIFGIAILSSCQNAADKVEAKELQEQKLSVAPPDSFALGTVINSVSLKTVPGENFALYLPTKYHADTAVPVLIFFDPHGNGNFPLRKYEGLAEKYGYMMMGSNNSKNGLSFQETGKFAQNLLTEALTRFNTSKIYFCGFSGGAKVALMAGSQLPKVEAVIYCGASTPIQTTHPIKLLGFAGTADMNYTDVVQFERELNDPQVEHYLIEWDGKHEFPSPEVFEEAFMFLETAKVENYAEKQATISPKDLMVEQKVKQEYLLAFQNKDLEWWRKTTDSLKSQTNKKSERLLGFVSLMCYSYTNQSLQQNSIAMAERALAIYHMADPDNEAIPGFEEQLKALK